MDRHSSRFGFNAFTPHCLWALNLLALLALFLTGGQLLPAAQAAEGLDCRFERMWPQLE